MDGHFDCKHRYLVDKNVPMALILPCRLQDGVESLGMETTSCLCYIPTLNMVLKGTKNISTNVLLTITLDMGVG